MKITQVTCGSAPIVLLYGSEGRGKSTLASKFPKPLAMLLERGLPAGVKLDAVDGLGAYTAVLESIRELYQDPRGYETIVIDTLDNLEPLLLEHVCAEHNWKNIETPPYGKGYVIADQHWQRFIKGIHTAFMSVVRTAPPSAFHIPLVSTARASPPPSK